VHALLALDHHHRRERLGRPGGLVVTEDDHHVRCRFVDQAPDPHLQRAHRVEAGPRVVEDVAGNGDQVRLRVDRPVDCPGECDLDVLLPGVAAVLHGRVRTKAEVQVAHG
jgi:hypothetical protein